MKKPNVGDVYQRGEKTRIVTRVTGGYNHYNVWWRPPDGKERKDATWCSKWEAWAEKATLVSMEEPSPYRCVQCHSVACKHPGDRCAECRAKNTATVAPESRHEPELDWETKGEGTKDQT